MFYNTKLSYSALLFKEPQYTTVAPIKTIYEIDQIEIKFHHSYTQNIAEMIILVPPEDQSVKGYKPNIVIASFTPHLYKLNNVEEYKIAKNKEEKIEDYIKEMVHYMYHLFHAPTSVMYLKNRGYIYRKPEKWEVMGMGMYVMYKHITDIYMKIPKSYIEMFYKFGFYYDESDQMMHGTVYRIGRALGVIDSLVDVIL